MGVQALHPFPLPHASWRCMCHTSLPMHHVSWLRVAFASPPTHRNRTGGGEGPWVGPPVILRLRLPTGGWWGPPLRGTSPRHPPSTCRDLLTPPRGGAARACGTSPRRPLLHYTGIAGRQESGGAPHCPERPPPTTAGAKVQPPPGGLLCKGGRGDRVLRTRPQRGSVPTVPGTDTRWEVATPPPITAPRPREEGNSPGLRPPPGRGKVPTARLILAPHFLFIVIPLGRPAPQSPRRVSSWGRTLRTSVTETQVVVSHPADVGSLRPHGTPGHPGHPSRG